MAISTKVQSSNMRPVKAGFEFVEVELTDTAPSGSGTLSAAIPLGKSYRSVKPVCATASLNANPSAYADCSASAAKIDGASIRLLYKANAGVTVTATLECEV